MKMPELQQRAFQKRLVAYKVRVFDILNGNLTKDDVSAGYIKINEVNVSRVNIIATLVHKSENLNYLNVLIDDGTGRIQLRSFESGDIFSKIDVGDVALVIGKIREFSGERYIVPEIFKKINDIGWIDVRKLELRGKGAVEHSNAAVKNAQVADESTSVISEEVYSLIKKLDFGDGVSIEEVIRNFDNISAEEIITDLLKKGDIFEIRPGRLKVLE